MDDTEMTRKHKTKVKNMLRLCDKFAARSTFTSKKTHGAKDKLFGALEKFKLSSWQSEIIHDISGILYTLFSNSLYKL